MNPCGLAMDSGQAADSSATNAPRQSSAEAISEEIMLVHLRGGCGFSGRTARTSAKSGLFARSLGASRAACPFRLRTDLILRGILKDETENHHR